MPSSITVVGLGPGDADQVTVEARRVLSTATELWLRTSRHPVMPSLPQGIAIHSFDHLYERMETFEQVYSAMAADLLELGRRPEGVVYAVPGHPLVGERSVVELLPMARAAGVPVRIVAGLSFLEPVFTALALDPLSGGLQLLDATALAAFAEANHGSATVRPGFVPTTPLLVGQLYSRGVASAIKLHLLEYYPPRHQIRLVYAAGIPGHERVRTLSLYRLDRVKDIDHLCCLYVPPLQPADDLADFAGLRYTVARLRGPQGCPWDREQTHDSLKPYLIEEAYEVLEALDAADPVKLSEELGDLLLQVVLHAQLGEEAGEFAMEDVLRGLNAKLIRRHPHVFADVVVGGSGEVVRNWEQIKRAERAGEKASASLLGGIPSHMPALAYALGLQKRAARAGFDWADPEGVAEKVREEIEELRQAPDDQARFRELGDLLFALVNLARWLKVDPEQALRQANRRFKARFEQMERLCEQRGIDFSRLSPAEQDALWNEVKRMEAADGLINTSEG